MWPNWPRPLPPSLPLPVPPLLLDSAAVVEPFAMLLVAVVQALPPQTFFAPTRRNPCGFVDEIVVWVAIN